MKKMGKIIALSFVALFLVTILAGVVSALTTDELTTGVKDFFVRIFGHVATGSAFEGAILKFLVLILLVLIIQPLVGIIPFLKSHSKISLAIAVLVSYLGTFYLVPAEIYALLQTYSALAMALTTIVPFAIILFFIWNTSQDPSPPSLLVGRLLAMFFAVFLVWRLFAVFFLTPLDGWKDQGIAVLLYVITLAATGVLLFWQRPLVRMLMAHQLEDFIVKSEMMDDATLQARIANLNTAIQDSISSSGAPKSRGGPNVFADKLIDAKEALEKYASHHKKK